MRGNNKIFNNLLLVRFEKRIIDADAAQITLSRKLNRHEPAARHALDFKLVELGLHGLHFRFKFAGLFHQAEKISHFYFPPVRSRSVHSPDASILKCIILRNVALQL